LRDQAYFEGYSSLEIH